jgi:DsbC/DsbD-like thiol-disulfide interchange protein
MVPLFLFCCSSFMSHVSSLPPAVSVQPATRPVLAVVEAVAVAAPVPTGSRIELVVRVTPKIGIHVYAPGEKRYKPVVLTIDRADGARAGQPVFPDSTWSTFEGERVRVYERAFDVRQPLHVTAPSGTTLIVGGTLEYQACDDLMCYLPVKVPLRWDVRVR